MLQKAELLAYDIPFRPKITRVYGQIQLENPQFDLFFVFWGAMALPEEKEERAKRIVILTVHGF